MIVVADTSPLNYLILIDVDHVLPALYGEVVIPTEVWNELQRSPAKVLQRLTPCPSWLEVRLAPPHVTHHGLHMGEAAAIALAKDVGAALLLVDDDHAYDHAVREGLAVTRTIGVLRDAASLNIIDLESVFEKLKQTNFRISRGFLDEILIDFRKRHPGT